MEVMVALAVVAVALPALMVSLFQQIDGASHLRDKSLAHMVAANKLSETRILVASNQRAPLGKDSGTTEIAGRQWSWWLKSTETQVEGFYRLEIKVAYLEEQESTPLHTLVAFLSTTIVASVQQQ